MLHHRTINKDCIYLTFKPATIEEDIMVGGDTWITGRTELMVIIQQTCLMALASPGVPLDNDEGNYMFV